ncbi:hypothetical protein AA309_28665, partial [Microvirga vignae]
MSINWLVTVQSPYNIIIPTYGEYGGPNYSDGHVLQPGEVPPLTTTPADDLDALYRAHDQVYRTSSDPLVLAQADLQLIRGIAQLSDAQLSVEAHLYAGATQLALIDQIKNRYGHPELFLPGEEALLAQDALDNLQKGGINPEPNEIAAALDLYDNLLEYAQGTLAGINLRDLDILVDDVFYF